MQSTENTQSDPPGFDNTENWELQLNHIHCETTVNESETENTLLINMLHIEKDNKTPSIRIITKTMQPILISKNQMIAKTL